MQKKNMKKLYTFFFLLIASLTAQAQLSGDGFYRFRNAQYNTDYIRLSNNLFDYNEIIAKACGGGSNLVDTSNYLSLLLGNVTFKEDGVARCLSCARAFLATDIHMVEDVIDPATIVYADKRYDANASNKEYNLMGQSISMTALTTGKYETSNVTIEFSNLYVTIETASGSGSNSLYTAKIPLTGTVTKVAGISFNKTQTLTNMYFVDDNGTFNVNESNSAQNAKWYIEPITHFNVQPEVEFGGKYYTTLYVPFAFTLSGQVEKAYAISAVNEDGTLEITEFKTGDTVPAGTPVVLECASNDASACQLTIANNAAPRTDNNSDYTGTNLLKGAYLCNQDGWMHYDTTAGTNAGSFEANNFTAPTKPDKYVLGITASGKLGFVKPDETVTAMPANKAWLEYTGSAELVLSIEAETILFGDVNRDDDITIADVTALVNIILGKATPEANPEYDFEAANVNGDDDITIADVTALVNIILGKPTN